MNVQDTSVADQAVDLDGGHGDGPGKTDPHLVEVTIDGNPKLITAGHYLVSDLKVVLGVPADYELDRVVGREFKPLPDGENVVVHKGEVFVSHVRRGGSA
jgi:hypothetical protein